MPRKKCTEIIEKASEGIISCLTNFLLFQCFLVTSSFGKMPTSRDAYKMFKEANSLLEEINYETFRKSFSILKRRGFLKVVKRELFFTPSITELGFKRLKEVIPTYEKERIWDKRVYIITYDIPENYKKDREVLRKFLKKIKAGMLQRSVWITPYNPKELLRKFIKERGLHGMIIVSDLGPDGNIGDETPKDLLDKIYDLYSVNERYRIFIEKFSKSKGGLDKNKVALAYLSILADDPQLPFELLPPYWLGDKANKVYEKILKAKLKTKKKEVGI